MSSATSTVYTTGSGAHGFPVDGFCCGCASTGARPGSRMATVAAATARSGDGRDMNDLNEEVPMTASSRMNMDPATIRPPVPPHGRKEDASHWKAQHPIGERRNGFALHECAGRSADGAHSRDEFDPVRAEPTVRLRAPRRRPGGHGAAS